MQMKHAQSKEGKPSQAIDSSAGNSSNRKHSTHPTICILSVDLPRPENKKANDDEKSAIRGI